MCVKLGVLGWVLGCAVDGGLCLTLTCGLVLGRGFTLRVLVLRFAFALAICCMLLDLDLVYMFGSFDLMKRLGFVLVGCEGVTG